MGKVNAIGGSAVALGYKQRGYFRRKCLKRFPEYSAGTDMRSKHANSKGSPKGNCTVSRVLGCRLCRRCMANTSQG